MTTATIIPSLTNNPPSRANPAAFPTDGDSFLNDLPDVVSGVNTAATELNTWNAEVETFKNQASSSQTNAASSSTTSLTQARNAAASMVSLWVSGTTYPAGQIVYSNVDGREYKRITAGTGTTDPSSDTANWEPLGWEYITNYPDIRPTLDLNFAGSQTVDPRITFTRNSIATYFDKFGVMQTAGVNQPRIDFDPVTGECKGLLIEEQRTNLLTYSQEFDNANWSKSNTTVTANAALAPDGTPTADKIIPTTTANQHSIGQTIGSVAPGTTHTLSVYAKAGEYKYLSLTRYDGVYYMMAGFDLVAGTINPSSVGTCTMVPVGNGWYRCTVTAMSTATASNVFQIRGNPDASIVSATPGDGFSGIYIWGAQLEAGAFPTSYIPTTTAQVTRTIDSAVMTGTNFSSWYRQDEGTLYSEYSTGVPFTQETLARPFYTGDGSTSNELSIYSYIGRQGAFVKENTLTQADNAVQTSPAASEFSKVAFAYRRNDFALCVGSRSVLTDSVGTIPPVSQARFGSIGGVLNGTIKRIAYYPKRLPNATLQAITQP